jgi:hypothetical protein
MKAKDRLGNNYHVYVYEDIDENDGTYISDYKVYVIDYTFGTTNGDSTAYVFSAQNITGNTTPSNKNLFGAPNRDSGVLTAVPGYFTLTVNNLFTGLSNTVTIDVDDSTTPAANNIFSDTFTVGFSSVVGVNDVVLDATYNTLEDQAELIRAYLNTKYGPSGTGDYIVTRSGATITLTEATVAAQFVNTNTAPYAVTVTGTTGKISGSAVDTIAASPAKTTYTMTLPRELVAGDKIDLTYKDASATETVTAVYVIGASDAILSLNKAAQTTALLTILNTKINSTLNTSIATAVPSVTPSTGAWFAQPTAATANTTTWSISGGNSLVNTTATDLADEISFTLR